MQTAAYVQVGSAELRLVVRRALTALSIAVVEGEPRDRVRPAVAVIELAATRRVAGELPDWLRDLNVPRLAVSIRSSEDLAIDALRHGFAEYLRAPVGEAEIAMAMQRLLPPPAAALEPSTTGIVGRSPAMGMLREQIARVAPARTNVLITGETGTGKELVAQAIHELSPRRSKPFVAVNCGAIPDGLVESELFGHERGAFTGAIQAQAGRIRQSSGGTLFLDEISELDLRGQVKLLRTLETREVQSLGSERARPLDLRVVAASNRNLTDRVRDGAFREDLLYRLDVVQLEVPPLRARSEDIPLLIGAFYERFCREFQRPAAAYATADLALLQRYDWPGNVRELRNVVEASFVQSSMRRDGLLELPPTIIAVLEGHSPRDERQRLIDALFLTRWNVSEAAQRLNCSRMTLYRKLTRYQLRRPDSLEQVSA